MNKLKSIIESIQCRLDFRNWDGHPQFASEKGLGRVAIISCALGSIFSLHAAALLIFCIDSTTDIMTIPILQEMSETRKLLLLQWLVYVLFLSSFHLAEFFVTAIYNPSEATATSFIVNHSKAYTGAMLVAAIEFWTRFILFPSLNHKLLAIIGLFLVAIGQVVRTLAMVTCGESFNHIIQQKKKQSHNLVTHGIYKHLRHPSYFGFFYWSIGTQLLLGNFVTSVGFTAAGWLFFNRRIPFEEHTLIRMFPEDYASYMEETHIGIPFIKRIEVDSLKTN